MQNPDTKTTESHLGYIFYPSDFRHSPGYQRLEVRIRSLPTNLHYDPERVSFPIVIENGMKETLKIFHPWRYAPEYQVCAGSIVLEDRKGKQVEAFTFGGNLQIRTQDEITICTFESEAPILEMGTDDPIQELLIEEVDILLAERSAAALPDAFEFEQRLAKEW